MDKVLGTTTREVRKMNHKQEVALAFYKASIYKPYRGYTDWYALCIAQKAITKLAKVARA